MSTTSDLYYDEETEIQLFEEALLGDEVSPAYIKAAGRHCKIQHDYSDTGAEVTICIPSKVMDSIAAKWLQRGERSLRDLLAATPEDAALLTDEDREWLHR